MITPDNFKFFGFVVAAWFDLIFLRLRLKLLRGIFADPKLLPLFTPLASDFLMQVMKGIPSLSPPVDRSFAVDLPLCGRSVTIVSTTKPDSYVEKWPDTVYYQAQVYLNLAYTSPSAERVLFFASFFRLSCSCSLLRCVLH